MVINRSMTQKQPLIPKDVSLVFRFTIYLSFNLTSKEQNYRSSHCPIQLCSLCVPILFILFKGNGHKVLKRALLIWMMPFRREIVSLLPYIGASNVRHQGDNYTIPINPHSPFSS